MEETYSIIIFSAFICSGLFSPRIGEVTFEEGVGVAMEVGVARFIGIDIDEDMGMEVEVAGRRTSWWCYAIENFIRLVTLLKACLKVESNLLVSATGQSDGDGSKQSVDDFEAHNEGCEGWIR
jgi:hypothetical protein